MFCNYKRRFSSKELYIRKAFKAKGIMFNVTNSMKANVGYNLTWVSNIYVLNTHEMFNVLNCVFDKAFHNLRSQIN